MQIGRKRGLLRAEILGHQLLNYEPDADGADDRREMRVAAPSDRPERHELKQHADQGRTDQPADQRAEWPEMPQQHKLQACERPHHEDFTMGEMQQSQHAKHKGIADRDQGVGAAEHHAVDELLQEHWPWPN